MINSDAFGITMAVIITIIVSSTYRMTIADNWIAALSLTVGTYAGIAIVFGVAYFVGWIFGG